MTAKAGPRLLVAALMLSNLSASAAQPEGAGLPPCLEGAEPPGDGSCDPFAFSNGTRIHRDDGTYIDPRSHEGRQIEDILRRQRRDAEENAAQQELFWKMTNAKNAAEAERILQEARAKNANAGTPNRIEYNGGQGDEPRRPPAAPAADAIPFEPAEVVAALPKQHAASPMRNALDESYRFSNGKFFQRKDGSLIDPESPDGKKLEGMIDEQRVRREPPAEREARLAGAKRAPQATREPDAERAARVRATRGDPAYTFSNGNQIRHKGGTAIRADSAEGKQIEAILERQRTDRAANAAQKELFWKMTNAKNAQEAMDYLRAAKAEDPDAGTKNVYLKKKK